MSKEATVEALESRSPATMAIAPVMRENAAVAAGDVAEYLAVLTDDAVFMAPNSRPKRGAELRAWLSAFVRDFRVEWLNFTSADLEVVQGLAYHTYSYTWRVTPRSGGEAKTSSGKGLHVLRRQPDGSWKIAREIWNSMPDQ